MPSSVPITPGSSTPAFLVQYICYLMQRNSRGFVNVLLLFLHACSSSWEFILGPSQWLKATAIWMLGGGLHEIMNGISPADGSYLVTNQHWFLAGSGAEGLSLKWVVRSVSEKGKFANHVSQENNSISLNYLKLTVFNYCLLSEHQKEDFLLKYRHNKQGGFQIKKKKPIYFQYIFL